MQVRRSRWAQSKDSRVPGRFAARARFGKLDWFTQRVKNADEIIAYCAEFAAKPSVTPAPLLIGKSGIGKTHLLYAILTHIVEHHDKALDEVRKSGIALAEQMIAREEKPYMPEFLKKLPWPDPIEIGYASGSDLAHDIRQSVNKGNIDNVIQSYRQDATRKAGMLSVLFIDDIEVMKMGDWLNEELYRIFDYRYGWQMPTVMASNLAPNELVSHFGDRITRRLLDMSRLVVIEPNGKAP